MNYIIEFRKTSVLHTTISHSTSYLRRLIKKYIKLRTLTYSSTLSQNRWWYKFEILVANAFYNVTP